VYVVSQAACAFIGAAGKALHVLVRLLPARISGEPTASGAPLLTPAAALFANENPCDSIPPMHDFHEAKAPNGMKLQFAPLGPVVPKAFAPPLT